MLRKKDRTRVANRAMNNKELSNVKIAGQWDLKQGGTEMLFNTIGHCEKIIYIEGEENGKFNNRGTR